MVCYNSLRPSTEGKNEWIAAELRSRCLDNNRTDKSQAPRVQNPMEFLLRMEDPTEILEGTFHIDMNAQHVRDVDDGLTVIGALDDWKDNQEQLQTALQTIDVITDEKDELAKASQQLRDELEAVKAVQAALTRSAQGSEPAHESTGT